MIVNVRLLGYLRKYNSRDNIQLTDPQFFTVEGLLCTLGIPKTEKFVVVVNDRRAKLSDQLKNDDCIVLLPCISGG